MIGRGPGLAAPLGAFDTDSAKGGKVFCYPLVDDTGFVVWAFQSRSPPMGLLYAIQTDFTITFRYIFYFCQDDFCVLRKRLRLIHRQPIRYINEAAIA